MTTTLMRLSSLVTINVIRANGWFGIRNKIPHHPPIPSTHPFQKFVKNNFKDPTKRLLGSVMSTSYYNYHLAIATANEKTS